MKPSILATANKHNPQPLPKRSVDSVVAPARVGVARYHTVVTRPGDVTVVDHFAPGARKLVSNSSEGVVRIVGKNTDNFDLGRESWVLLENTGDGWRGLYHGDGATRAKKRRKEGES